MGEYKFTLINLNGCKMDTVTTTSFEKARKRFNLNYTGKYTIYCDSNGEHRIVILK